MPETSTPVAFGILSLTPEMLIPRLYEFLLMFFNNPENTPNFRFTESAAFLQLDRFEPEFRNAIVALYVHVTGFVAIAGVEEKPVRSLIQYGGHPQSRE